MVYYTVTNVLKTEIQNMKLVSCHFDELDAIKITIEITISILIPIPFFHHVEQCSIHWLPSVMNGRARNPFLLMIDIRLMSLTSMFPYCSLIIINIPHHIRIDNGLLTSEVLFQPIYTEW